MTEPEESTATNSVSLEEYHLIRRPFSRDTGLFYLNTFAVKLFDLIDRNILAEDPETSKKGESLTIDACKEATTEFMKIWAENKENSEFAFEGLLLILERCLSQKHDNYFLFYEMVRTLHDSALAFLQEASIYLLECDARNGTDYTELLIQYLNIYQAKTGDDLAAAFVSKVPHFGEYYLKKNAKVFTELFAFGKMMERRVVDIHGSTMVVILSKCLSWLHFTARRVVVSNAPPVKLNRKPVKSKVTYEISAAAGGLVSGIMPCMRAEDLWFSFIEDTVLGMNRMPLGDLAKNMKKSDMVTTKLQRGPSVMKATLSDGGKDENEVTEPLWLQTEQDLQRMQRMLNNFAEKKFVVNPVIIVKKEHKPFYNGISNGLLWPAFHNLTSYIVDEYKNEKNRSALEQDWIKYIKVNHYFASHTAQRCRPQDFLWIQDYHLCLVGQMLRSLSPEIHCGFFLHTPYLVSPKFFERYKEQAMAILRGLLAFSRIGFHTQRDVNNFVRHVQKYLPSAEIVSERKLGDNRHAYTISYNGFEADVGAFGISINHDQLIEWATDKTVVSEFEVLKQKLLEGRPKGSKLFVCVERFDYTKGIEERLKAFQHYLRALKEAGEERRDVYYQIASSSRTEVSSYQEYQKRVTKIAEEINEEFENTVRIDTENHPPKDVVKYYLAADVIVVTPAADGMNLVVKEAIVSNPKAVVVLSTGAGAENQFSVAGLQSCYLRVEDIKDIGAFSEILNKAATMDPKTAEERGKTLFNFVKENDIKKWLDGYLDSSWCHDVAPVSKLTSMQQFQEIMLLSRDNRRAIVKCVLENKPYKEESAMSLENIKRTLEIALKESDDADHIKLNGLELNVKDEVTLLRKDCRFLSYYKNEADVDGFIDYLAESHPQGKEAFKEEMNNVLRMLNFDLSDGIDVFITDWDGTIKTYACNYRTSMQPAYSGVILAQFVNRYTKYAAVLTAGPLRDFGILDSTAVPWQDGYLAFGGSLGREWMINGKRIADESVLTNEKAAALDRLSEDISGLLKNEMFSKFEVVGSGFQRKLDRVTVGIQNVNHAVDQDLSKRYINAVLDRVNKIDPNRKLFEIIHLELDLEIVLKRENSVSAWTKADGIRYLLEHIKKPNEENFANGGSVLICGDTVSDLPMVEAAHQENPNGTYAIFVNPNNEVKAKLTEILGKRQCVVGCVEVLHAAMAKNVLRPMFVMNEV